MTEVEANRAMRESIASLESEERAELARELLETSRSRRIGPAGRPVPAPLVWLSRISLIGLFAYYWSLSGFTARAALGLIRWIIFPGAVVCWPNFLANVERYVGVAPRLRRRSPPRWVLLLGWVILLTPLAVRSFMR
jgi:hypothetical protein